jgi:branched-chain amino acid aminotransferase
MLWVTVVNRELLRLDRDWIPEGDGYSLYIRPTGISTQASVGVGASESAKLFIILSPVGPYYPGASSSSHCLPRYRWHKCLPVCCPPVCCPCAEGFNPVKLYATDKFVRAWPGGTGGYKLGSYVVASQ